MTSGSNEPTDAGDAGDDGDVVAWVEHATGGRVVDLRRTGTGGSRVTSFVAVETPGRGVEQLVLRTEGTGSFTGTELTLTNEVTAYRALGRTSVPVPAIRAVRPDGSAFLMDRVAGTDSLSGLPGDEVERILEHFVDCLAAMHRLDPERLDLPGFERPRSSDDVARVDLRRWLRLASRVEHLDPLLAFAGAWLLANAPEGCPVSFVQGDTGPGNFVHDGQRVTGLVDMEFAHLGDPMDDLAWLRFRLRDLQVDEGALRARYEARSGVRVDDHRVGFFELAVRYRCAVTTSLAVAGGGGARGWAAYLLQTQRFVHEVAEHLSRLTGIALPEPIPIAVAANDRSDRSDLFDRLLQSIRAAVAALPEGEVREETRNSQILVRHLHALDRFGGAVDDADRDDQRATFGAALDHPELHGRAERAGRVADLEFLAYLLRRVERRRLLWTPLLDRGRRAR